MGEKIVLEKDNVLDIAKIVSNNEAYQHFVEGMAIHSFLVDVSKEVNNQRQQVPIQPQRNQSTRPIQAAPQVQAQQPPRRPQIRRQQAPQALDMDSSQEVENDPLYRPPTPPQGQDEDGDEFEDAGNGQFENQDF